MKERTIRIRAGFEESPRIRVLERTVGRRAGVGTAFALWSWFARQNMDSIHDDGHAAGIIEMTLEWTGEPGALFGALVAGAFLVRDGERWSVPDMAVVLDARSLAAVRQGKPRVYFLQDPEGRIKIGFSRNVLERAAKLQRDVGAELRLLGTIKGDSYVEGNLHRQFAHLRIGGEWFLPGPDLLAFIANIKAGA